MKLKVSLCIVIVTLTLLDCARKYNVTGQGEPVTIKIGKLKAEYNILGCEYLEEKYRYTVKIRWTVKSLDNEPIHFNMSWIILIAGRTKVRPTTGRYGVDHARSKLKHIQMGEAVYELSDDHNIFDIYCIIRGDENNNKIILDPIKIN